jgi:glutamate--cysteine ligase
MKSYLPTRGRRALDMMRRTATVQANFDYESADDAMRKLRLALKLSPLVTAIMANSPFYEGKISGDRSERAKVWLEVDPDRQGLLPKLWNPRSTIVDYVEWALDAPMFLVKRDNAVVHNTGQTFRSFLADGFQEHQATMVDWETHLNTLFPEVRLKHTLEVRGGDSLPARLATALPALWTGILYDDRALAEAEALSASWSFDEIEKLRPQIAAAGLTARFRGKPLADTAQALIAASRGGLARRGRRSSEGKDETVFLAGIAGLAEGARCPADILLDGLEADAPDLRAQIVARCRV